MTQRLTDFWSDIRSLASSWREFSQLAKLLRVPRLRFLRWNLDDLTREFWDPSSCMAREWLDLIEFDSELEFQSAADRIEEESQRRQTLNLNTNLQPVTTQES